MQSAFTDFQTLCEYLELSIEDLNLSSDAAEGLQPQRLFTVLRGSRDGGRFRPVGSGPGGIGL